jgi:ketosteroid isomerase-like protein
MTEREENERLLRAGVEAYNRGDVRAMVDLFDPEIELYVDSAQGNPGTWHGLEGFQRMVESWRDAFAEDRSEVIGLEMVSDRHLIAEMRQTAIGSVSGVPVEMTNYYLLELRDGRAVRFHIYGDRETAMAAVRGESRS